MIGCYKCRMAYEPPRDSRLDVGLCLTCASLPHHEATRLFVYGTLKHGGYWNYLLRAGGATFCHEDVAPGFATYGGFPVAGPHPTMALKGELWAGITPALWARLDQLERSYTPQAVTLLSGELAVIYVGRFWRMAGNPAEEYVITEQYRAREDR